MSRNCRLWKGAVLGGALALLLAPYEALAENAALTPAPSADARTDAQKAAFLAMPDADRKAVQDALGWLGLYTGAVDGAWGKRTRDSILAYQASQSAPADGVVAASQLAAMRAAARKARAAVGFEIVDERRSGVRIGAPLKILPKIAMVGGDATIEAPDGSVALTMQARAGDQPTLAALYAKLNAESNGRKVTYKAIKADDFFVVAGEDGARKFYTRFAKSPPDWADGPSLRGFTFSYPKDQAGDLDKVALAIANSFEPFSSSPSSLDTAAARAASALTWRDIVKPAPMNEAAAPSSPNPVAAAPPPAPATLATGLVVGPGQAVTAAAPADCATVTVDGKPAKILRADAASGLALVGGDFSANGAPPRIGVASGDLVALSISDDAGAAKPTLAATPATLAGPDMVVAALAKSAAGAPLFDRKGGLAALVAPIRSEPSRVAGVALAQPHPAIGSDAVARFLGLSLSAPGQGPDLGVGDIAREKGAAVVEVACRP
ncbi:MAG TPA: peptidoglycan-binding domain-containing protein [Roseiarcus sp.]|jgi:peptidoglycan hydrolase-like protein with peptidoglycan-binding domain